MLRQQFRLRCRPRRTRDATFAMLQSRSIPEPPEPLEMVRRSEIAAGLRRCRFRRRLRMDHGFGARCDAVGDRKPSGKSSNGAGFFQLRANVICCHMQQRYDERNSRTFNAPLDRKCWRNPETTRISPPRLKEQPRRRRCRHLRSQRRNHPPRFNRRHRLWSRDIWLPHDVASLIKRGEDLIKSGDLALARLALRRAAGSWRCTGGTTTCRRASCRLPTR